MLCWISEHALVQVKSKSALGLELESIMKEGKLVPQETTIALLRKAMVASGCEKFLVDGFPRALDQVSLHSCPCFHELNHGKSI